MLKQKLVFYSAILIAICGLAVCPGSSFAQGIGGGGFGGYGGGFGGYGGFGGGGYGGFGGGAAGGLGAVLVKYGEKVYDAVFGDLIDYKVYYINVPADTIGVHYFDDGTNGDLVPYDGIPSNIILNRDTYLGPFSIKYKHQIKSAIDVAERMGAHEFYSLIATSENPKSQIATIAKYTNQFEGMLDDARAHLAQYEGYDDEKYVLAVDPSLFDSLEGFGGIGAGGGGFGGTQLLPDLPPPPGLPTPNVRQGLPDSLTNESGVSSTQDTNGSPPARPFSPLGRTMETVNGLNALNQ